MCRSHPTEMVDPLIGAHMSISGGYHESVERAFNAGCRCVQIFTKNNNQWRAKPLEDSEAALFQEALRRRKISFPLSHSSYLINIASPDPELWKKSIDGLVVEVLRAAQLGIPHVVLHPGARMTQTEKQGLARANRGLNEVFKQTRNCPSGILLETTAGQGTCLGDRFEHLAELLGSSKYPEKLGVCLDTCHIFAAGYSLADAASYEATMAEFEQSVGLAQIKAFHLNDSVREQGSRVDRHAHIGRGAIGQAAFQALMNDARFVAVPKYLETPKGEENGKDLDRMNLAKLRRMVGKGAKEGRGKGAE